MTQSVLIVHWSRVFLFRVIWSRLFWSRLLWSICSQPDCSEPGCFGPEYSGLWSRLFWTSVLRSSVLIQNSEPPVSWWNTTGMCLESFWVCWAQTLWQVCVGLWQGAAETALLPACTAAVSHSGSIWQTQTLAGGNDSNKASTPTPTWSIWLIKHLVAAL